MADMAPTSDESTLQGANIDKTWGAEGGFGATDGHLSSHTDTEHHSLDEQVHEEPDISDDSEQAFNAATIPTPGDDVTSDGEYEPESTDGHIETQLPASVPAPVPDPVSIKVEQGAVLPRPSKKPKKAGGFIVGSSDDEDEAPKPIIDSPTTSHEAVAPLAPPINVDDPTRTLNRSPLQKSGPAQDTNGPPVVEPAQVSNGHADMSADAVVTGALQPQLPTDIIVVLEIRIKDDPKGDVDAWMALIEEHRRRNVISETRAAYERFFQVFPQSSDMWLQYLDMELSLDNFVEAENIFNRTLFAVPSVQLWTAYLNYIRRRHDLNDPTGAARRVVNESYEFVLDNIGQDREAGRIWQDYIQFIKSGPGSVGGTNWQDQQKMDVLRKAYQRATCIPMANLNTIWNEYNQFELGLNKAAGRRFLQDRSPWYMSARSANTYLENATRDLQKPTVPRLPPAPGFDGDQEYLEQVELWKKLIAWEKDDPLALKRDEPGTYKSRVLHMYKQALMPLRFWPELWVDAAEWCFEHGIKSSEKKGQEQGLIFLADGVAANPESSLLALKHADRIESTLTTGDGDAGKTALAIAVRAPYEKAFDTLYDMVQKLKERETAAIAQIGNDPSLAPPSDAEDDDEGDLPPRPANEDVKKQRIKAVQDSFAVQVQMLQQQITHLWIALARALRRIQGQGAQGKGDARGTGIRGVLTEARRRGRLTSDFYVAIAYIESDIYQDHPVATRIFERGAKLFPEDEDYMVAYLKFLHSRHDTTNARVVFSQAVKRFKEKPESHHKLKPLFAYFHRYEAKMGELAQIKELERQMAESFPEDPRLTHFSARFATNKFNPLTVRLIISPGAQLRPKTIMQSVEKASASIRGSPYTAPAQMDRSPRPQHLQLPAVKSPKRGHQDDQEDHNPPVKRTRGASPLKGAAGRRMDQQRRTHQAAIPRDVTFLMSLIPPAHQFDAQRYRPDALARLIRDTRIPDFAQWKAQQNQGPRAGAHNRPVSSEYPTHGRDSPAYEPPPAGYGQGQHPAGYGQVSAPVGYGHGSQPNGLPAGFYGLAPPPASFGQGPAAAGFQAASFPSNQPSWAQNVPVYHPPFGGY